MNEDLLLNAYDYHLPPELIAKVPASKRDESKLLTYVLQSQQLADRMFFDLPEILKPGDLLVLNDTKVINVRLRCHRESGAKVEVFFLTPKDDQVWIALTKCSSKLRIGEELLFNNVPVVKIIASFEDGSRELQWLLPDDLLTFLDKNGEPPLPPYILKEREKVEGGGVSATDKDRYQTIYAKHLGAVAAPTAGLHFTEELFANLQAKQIEKTHLTLHVGYGTFSPVKEENITSHQMHSEFFELHEISARKIRETKKNGGRIIAVGTTSGRTLESVFDEKLFVKEQKGDTNIFIYPGYQLKVIDGIITNFHLPQSSLLMFISAIMGRKNLFKCYEHAIAKNYRFYSYGDAMCIFPD